MIPSGSYAPVQGNDLVLYFVVIAACLNIISLGSAIGWPMTAIAQLLSSDTDLRLNERQSAFVASMLFAGSLIGTLVMSICMKRFGAKRVLLFTVLPTVIGWLMVGFAWEVWMLYVGRVLLGCQVGGAYLMTDMYIGEIARPSNRGLLCGASCISINVGFLLAFIIGPYVTYQQCAFLNLLLPIGFLATFVWAPESPYWYIKKSRFEDARDSLVKLRRTDDVDEELHTLRNLAEKDDERSRWRRNSFISIFYSRANRRSLLLTFVIIVAQQFSGIQAVNTYAHIVFEKSDSLISGKYVGMLLGCVELLCVIGTSSIVDSLGRRPLLMISSVGSACCMVVVGAYFHMEYAGMKLEPIKLLPVIGVLLFATLYGIGLSPLITVIIADCVPLEIRHIGVLLGGYVYSLSAMAVIILWQVISDGIGTQYAFGIFGTITYINTVILYFLVPETKKKSLVEIQDMLRNGKKSNDTDN